MAKKIHGEKRGVNFAQNKGQAGHEHETILVDVCFNLFEEVYLLTDLDQRAKAGSGVPGRSESSEV